jgi:hypothetical protein
LFIGLCESNDSGHSDSRSVFQLKLVCSPIRI